jgi:hypothetical protein
MLQPLLDSETMDEIYRFQGGAAGCVERLFDGTRTLAQVCEEGGMSATRALALVERLTGRGELVLLDPQTSGFSPLDEAFFASEVAVDEWEWDEPAEPATSRMRRALGRLRDRLVHRPRLAAATAH